MKLIKTTDDHVAVLPLKRVETKTTKGIVLPTAAREPFVIWGVVVGVGPGHRNETGELNPMHLRVGDKVLYLREGVRHTYQDVEIDGVNHDAVSIVQERDINLYVRDGGPPTPLNDYVIGKVVKEEVQEIDINTIFGTAMTWGASKITEGGLVIPSFGTEEKVNKEMTPLRVRLTKLGPGRRTSLGVLLPQDVAEDDIILVSKHYAWEFVIDESDPHNGYVVIKADAIHGIEG